MKERALAAGEEQMNAVLAVLQSAQEHAQPRTLRNKATAGREQIDTTRNQPSLLVPGIICTGIRNTAMTFKPPSLSMTQGEV
jgi:hypothetical protein